MTDFIAGMFFIFYASVAATIYCLRWIESRREQVWKRAGIRIGAVAGAVIWPVAAGMFVAAWVIATERLTSDPEDSNG